MPRTVLPDARAFPRFAGLTTFGRYPRLADVLPANLPVDWAVYGAPFDAGVTYRPGARFGPRAIRNESQYLKRYSIVHDVDLCDEMSLVDAGDSPVRPYSCEENAKVQSEFALTLGDPSHTRLLALGGDHSIAYANLHATWMRRGMPKGGLALVHFDSHLDTVDEVWGEAWGHASVFRRAIEHGLVDPKRMLSLGVKGPLNRRDDLEYARDMGITLLTCEQVRSRGTRVIREYVERLDGSQTYITFDIDCVDPAFAPGTGTPSVGGFSSAEAIEHVRALAGVHVIGGDVVEVLPDRDPSGITSLLGAHIAFEIMCLDAVFQRRDRRA